MLDKISDILYMIEEQSEICGSLYPDRVFDVLLYCYGELVDLEMELDDEGEILGDWEMRING